MVENRIRCRQYVILPHRIIRGYIIKIDEEVLHNALFYPNFHSICLSHVKLICIYTRYDGVSCQLTIIIISVSIRVGGTNSGDG